MGAEPEQEEEEQLTGLVDKKNKISNDEDIARESDLAIARNMRRLEIHRFQIAQALNTVSEEDIGPITDHEEEIELPESEHPLTDATSLRSQSGIGKKTSLDPDAAIDERLEKWSTVAKKFLHWLTVKLDLKSWDFMMKNLMLTVHRLRHDREIEARLFSPLAQFRTMGRARTLREREAIAPCAPVKLVNWSLDVVASYQEGGSLRHFIFIDPEAGHGRTLLLASHRDFRAIYGLETRGNLYDDAKMNIAQYPRTYMVQRQVELISKDFRLVEWPDSPLVVHIFNPQSAEWLNQFIETITQSYVVAPRQIYLIVIDNPYKHIITQNGFMRPFTPHSSHIELISLMSPYDIDFYCTDLA